MRFDSGARVTVAIDNPRKVGKHYFLRREDGAEYFSDARETPRDMEIYDYGAQIIVLVRLRDGRTVFPLFKATNSRFDATGAATVVKVRSPLLTAIRPEHPYIDVPLGQDIASYILLVNGLTESTGWRICELDAAPANAGSRDLRVPDLTTLPILGEKDPLWRPHRDAEDYYKRTAKR